MRCEDCLHQGHEPGACREELPLFNARTGERQSNTARCSCGSRDLDLDRVVELLKGADIPAYVEQTGGGCATIYAGELKDRPERGEDYPRWDACAGPGWFEGPGWTLGRGSVYDFVVGPDDDGEGEVVVAQPDWTEESVAAAIVAEIKKGAGR